MAIKEKHFGKDHVEVATTVNNLSSFLEDLGHFKDARCLYERALANLEKHFGKDHVEVATTVNNLGLVLDKQGHFEDARCL